MHGRSPAQLPPSGRQPALRNSVGVNFDVPSRRDAWGGLCEIQISDRRPGRMALEVARLISGSVGSAKCRPPKGQRACVPFVTRTYAVNKPMCHKPTCAVWRADPRAWAALGRGPPHRNPNFRRCPRGLAYAYDGLGRGPTRPSKPGDDKCCRGPACGQALGSKLIDALDVTIAARPRPWVLLIVRHPPRRVRSRPALSNEGCCSACPSRRGPSPSCSACSSCIRKPLRNLLDATTPAAALGPPGGGGARSRATGCKHRRRQRSRSRPAGRR